MDARMSKLITINMTGQEVQDLIMDNIYLKYPDLANADKWDWEDFYLNFNSQKLGDAAVDVVFTQHTEYVDDGKETPNADGGGI